MARTTSNIFVRSLEKLRGVLLRAPAQPSPAPRAPKAGQRSSAKASPKHSSSAVPAGEAGVEPSQAQDTKPAKKKIPAQPWYRHRQRW
jgi:hypothetical protein